MRRRPGPGGRDDGMVTAEAAVALPVLVLVAVFAVAVVLAAGERTRLVDAAHVTALAAARDDAGAVALGERVAPGARIVVAAEEHTVTVTVTATLDVGPVHGPTVAVTAVAPREPGPTESGPTGPGPTGPGPAGPGPAGPGPGPGPAP